MTARFRVSVVIPTRQRRDSVLRTLASLRRQTLPAGDYEVLVCVDGSSDDTAAAVRAFTAPYTCSVLEAPHGGRARARNSGIGAATGDLVVLLDDDMEASPGFLEAHLRAHEGPRERAVVGAAPIVVPQDAPSFVRYAAEGFRSRLERLGRPGYRPGFRDAYSGNFSCRRDVLQAVGTFDETFTMYGHEDYELALRLEADGVTLAYSAEAVAHQHYEKSFRDFAPDGLARGHTAVLFAQKHPEVADQLKLADYHRGDWKWRVLRSLLLGLGRVAGATPEWVVARVERFERSGTPRLHKYYRLAADYLFWQGATQALRESRRRSAEHAWATYRVRLAMLLVILYAGVSAMSWLGEASQWPATAKTDEISDNDRRFGELRAVLPSGGTVGYLGDPVVGGATALEQNDSALQHFRRYLLAQYALAPVVLVENTEPELVVGNFDREAVRPPPPGFGLDRDLGDGLVLYRRSSP